MKIEGNVITAYKGKVLTNGEVYAIQIWLGNADSVDNWNEVSVEDVPEEYLDSLFTEWSDEQKTQWEEEHPEGEGGENG